MKYWLINEDKIDIDLLMVAVFAVFLKIDLIMVAVFGAAAMKNKIETGILCCITIHNCWHRPDLKSCRSSLSIGK